MARAELTSVPVMCPLSQDPLCALRPVLGNLWLGFLLRDGVGQPGADLRAAHARTHCGPDKILRADGHVRGKLHAHARPARALLCALLRRSGVLCRLCPRREWIAERIPFFRAGRGKRKLDCISTSPCPADVLSSLVYQQHAAGMLARTRV